MKSTTTTQNGFRVEDITFKGARRQSAINESNTQKQENEKECVVPVSMTPEQVKSFLLKKADANPKEEKVYNQVISWIDECFSLRKKVVSLETVVETFRSLKEVADKSGVEENV